MRYAIIQTGGKQYRVTEGDVVEIEHIDAVKDSVFEARDVLLFSTGDNVMVGKPFVSGVKVTGMVLDEKKGEKLRVSQFKAKARHRRVTGHRHLFSVVRIDSIALEGEKKSAPAKVEKAVNKTAKKSAKPAKTE